MSAPKATRYYNMDVVRYFLAITVIVAHFNELAGASIPWIMSSYNAVGGFFALSGFLVYPSFVRHRQIGRYIGRRARRILPPYLLIVFVAAFALVFLSSLPAAAYYSDAGFWKYLICNTLFLNFLSPTLPGVFDSAQFAMPAVNGSLWTMKVEWLLYLSVPVVAWFTAKMPRRWQQWVLVAIIAMSIGYRIFLEGLAESTGKEIYAILGRQFCGQLSYFYMGALLYFNRDRLMRHRWLIGAIVLALLAVTALAAEPLGLLRLIIDPIAIGACVIWLSVVGDWGRRLSRHDNVSYDMYLFHFPIIQAAVALGVTVLNQYVGFVIVLSVTTLFSLLSWNLIGRYFLNSRKTSQRQ